MYNKFKAPTVFWKTLAVNHKQSHKFSFMFQVKAHQQSNRMCNKSKQKGKVLNKHKTRT